MNKLLILVVEDDPPVRNLITTTLKTNDYRYLVAANGETDGAAWGWGSPCAGPSSPPTAVPSKFWTIIPGALFSASPCGHRR